MDGGKGHGDDCYEGACEMDVREDAVCMEGTGKDTKWMRKINVSRNARDQTWTERYMGCMCKCMDTHMRK